MEFIKFKEAVAKQWSIMRVYDLYRTAAGKDEMWDTYLESFPAGTNPIFRTRREYDCSCCKQFIRAIGNVVAIVDGKLVSIWDCQVGDPNYQVVADALSTLVKRQPLENIFLHTERTAGTDRNFEEMIDGVKEWNHFFVNIPCGGRNGEKNFVVKKADIGPALSESRALHDVLYRSLRELSDDAIDTVLELIAQNSLYRGDEHKFAVETFKALKHEFNALATGDRDNFSWLKSRSVHPSVAKIRNTSIGTLLINLSEGMELEAAVKAFETLVAPASYKRPSALVTKGMIESAKKKIEEFGLLSALERRYATINDINVNDILWADRAAKKNMAGNVFDDIASTVADKKPNLDRVDEIGIEKFVADILPTATAVELMVENRHSGNLVSLIAPMDPTAGQLFKWNNPYSWSYSGDMADSIKERVKRAGGNVTGDFCCRLAWFNHDDLDFHMHEPGGKHIYFGTYRGNLSPCGGMLDVDMNAGGGRTREPVENIFYGSSHRMQEGTYILNVHQYNKREATDVGFEVEVDFMGTVHRFVYDKSVRQGETILVAEFAYSKKDGLKIIRSLPSTSVSKTVWGIQTEAFQKVDVVMMSPNFWSGQGVGNKHYFFMLNGCKNDGTARGFFNEFLKSEFDQHRKVFEIVGAKMQTAESANQLSGLGFSSTQRNSVLVRVSGAFTRVVKVVF